MSSTHFVEMSEAEFTKEAIGIVEKAQSRGVCLRILGSLAAYIRSVNNGHGDLVKSLGRFGEGMPLFTIWIWRLTGNKKEELTNSFVS